VVGCGVSGSRIAAHLAAEGCRVALFDQQPHVATGVARRTGGVTVDRVSDLEVCDAVVVTTPAPHLHTVTSFVAAGVTTVTMGDDLHDVEAILGLHQQAAAAGVPVVVGAGMAPGLSGLLARHLALQLHVVDELHVATHGTAGPACAYQHHDALGSRAVFWHDFEWQESPGGSGRDLVWFPEPVEAHDCYRAALPDPLLLQRAFPTVGRISARVSATRRDRLTARLPMLTPPHPSGDLGAVRVEARGASESGERLTVIAGASGATADLAGAVCAATVLQVLAHGRNVVGGGVWSPADQVVAGLEVLHHATRLGVRVQEFTGVARASSW
jgi:hypothetical protein